MNKDAPPALDPAAPRRPGEPQAHTDDHDVPFRVTLVRGDIAMVQAPVIVAGLYKGIAPINAVGALDEALDYWISEAASRSMIGGDLGELFFVPIFDNSRLKSRSVLLAGMGEFGKFTYEALCYLMMNVAYGVSNLGVEKFAGVIIGPGVPDLPLDRVVKGMLSGICDGLHHLPKERRSLKEFVLVELDRARLSQILEVLREFEREQTIGNLALTVEEGAALPEKVEAKDETAHERPAARVRALAPPRPLPGSYFVNRINVERSAESFRYSALTDTAVVPQIVVEVQNNYVEEITSRLQVAGDNDEQDVGRVLHRLIFPDEFDPLITNRNRQDGPLRALTLVLDRASMPLPWEMACFVPPDESEETKARIYFGTDLRLTRQFRTQLAGAPAIAPPVNRSLRVLVIADPAREPELQLEGARQEGQEIAALLREHAHALKASGELDIEVVSRIGHEECRIVDILNFFFNKNFDVIHFSGHGVFDAEHPNQSGWVFGKNSVFSAREIFRTRRVPRLVFANACFSAATLGVGRPKGKAKGKVGVAFQDKFTPEATNKKLAGMAEAFFERGVQNYIGTGWKVNDEAATRFATTFYARCLAGHLIGDALAAARREIFEYGSTWGAYQHYGQSNARLTARWPR
jgi:hypothetical protein